MTELHWRDYPWLFVGGGFQFRFKSGGPPRDCEGIDSDSEIGLWIPEQTDPMLDLVWGFPEDLALIARPISDMTDEEVVEYYNRYKMDYLDEMVEMLEVGDRSEYIGKCREAMPFHGNGMRYPQFLYLLSIGVYPFDQSHFETGDVIKKEDV